ncbi:unnamed protein product, partial [marine sediment metagenome]
LLSAIGAARLPGVVPWLLAYPRRAPSRRSALGRSAGLSAALAVLVAAPFWLVDETLLDPRHLVVPLAAAPMQRYAQAAAAEPDSPLRRRRLALVMMIHGDSSGAAEQLAVALRLTPPDPEERSTYVRRAVILQSLAAAYAGSGQAALARQAQAAHVTHVQALRDGMQSDDPFVRSEFDRAMKTQRAQARPSP